MFNFSFIKISLDKISPTSFFLVGDFSLNYVLNHREGKNF